MKIPCTVLSIACALVVAASSTRADTAVPGAPVGLSAVAPSSGEVLLTWGAPATGGAPTAYAIEAGSNPGLANLANFSTESTATTFSASGVAAGTYYVRVRATNSAGTSAPSNEAALVVGGGCSAAPTAPGAPNVVSNSGGTIVLSWTASAGSPTTYLVEAGSAPGASNLASLDLGSSSPTMTATGVGAGIYYVRIRGTNACGTGAASPELTLVVPSSATFAITSVSPASPIVSTASQTITINGVGFRSGAGLIVTEPRRTPVVYGPPQLLALTSTAIQVSLPLAVAGTWTFQVQNPSGEHSDSFPVTTQFRTSGSTWIPEGVRITGSDVGEPLSNPSALRLPDGRWRLFFNNTSAVSSDGVAFTLERGRRFVGGSPRALRLDDGRVRIYYVAPDSTGISSAISNDEGRTFTTEPGERLSAAAAGLPTLTNPGIARMASGGWRMYFSERGQDLSTAFSIKSATSTDLLNWTMDPGVRLGAGSSLTGNSMHPSALANSDGSVTLFYWRNIGPTGLTTGFWTTTSPDGLTFTTETVLESLGKGADPDIVRVGDGLRLYYNWQDDIYSAFNPTGALGIASTSPDVVSGERDVTTAADARRMDAQQLRGFTDQVLDASSPVPIPASHSMRARISQAEDDFRHHGHPSISERAIVSALNSIADDPGSLRWLRTSVSEFHAFRLKTKDRLGLDLSIEMSPLEAVSTALWLASGRMMDVLPPPVSTMYLLALDTWLTDETSAASLDVHVMLDRLGIRR